MRFSTFIFPLTVLAGLVLASPLEERGTRLTEVASASGPKYGTVSFKSKPSPEGVHVQGGKGATVENPGKSKRSDYNQLDGRKTPYGVLTVCTSSDCGGDCYDNTLPVDPNICHRVHSFNSFVISASEGLTYGVYVGVDCAGVLRSHPFSERLI